MAALYALKSSLSREMVETSAELMSFDRVFDEDELSAKTEQWAIVKEEIDRLEMAMMNTMINNCQECVYTDTENFGVIADKMTVFHQKEAKIHQEIQEMMSLRDELYAKWKQEYLANAEKFSDAQNKLRRIQDIENVLLKLSSKGIKASNNLILLVYIHSQVNALLSIAGISKENVPYKAFQVAWQNQLVDDRTYEFLKP